jgi:hypothetical protein
MEGMPLKLMIAAIVVAITVPLIFTSLRAYDYSSVEQQLLTEISEFCALVQSLFMMGPGNTALHEFRIPEGSFAKVDEVRIGDTLGGNRSNIIGFRLLGRTEKLTAIQDPCVPLSSRDNDSLILSAGIKKIRLECVQSLFDLNDDGFTPDAYLMLSIE